MCIDCSVNLDILAVSFTFIALLFSFLRLILLRNAKAELTTEGECINRSSRNVNGFGVTTIPTCKDGALPSRLGILAPPGNFNAFLTVPFLFTKSFKSKPENSRMQYMSLSCVSEISKRSIAVGRNNSIRFNETEADQFQISTSSCVFCLDILVLPNSLPSVLPSDKVTRHHGFSKCIWAYPDRNRLARITRIVIRVSSLCEPASEGDGELSETPVHLPSLVHGNGDLLGSCSRPPPQQAVHIVGVLS